MKVEQHGDTYIFLPEIKNQGRVSGSLFFLSGYYAVPGFIFIIMSLGTFLAMDFVGAIISATALMAIGIGMVIAGYRTGKRAIQKEKIIIAPVGVTITNGSNSKTYPLEDITGVYYVGYAEITDHPLKTGGFDYLGFETGDKQIARIHDDGHLKLVIGEKEIFFGKELASWDAQVISDILRKVTDGRLFVQNLPEEIPEEEYMAGGPAEL